MESLMYVNVICKTTTHKEKGVKETIEGQDTYVQTEVVIFQIGCEKSRMHFCNL